MRKSVDNEILVLQATRTGNDARSRVHTAVESVVTAPVGLWECCKSFKPLKLVRIQAPIVHEGRVLSRPDLHQIKDLFLCSSHDGVTCIPIRFGAIRELQGNCLWLQRTRKIVCNALWGESLHSVSGICKQPREKGGLVKMEVQQVPAKGKKIKMIKRELEAKRSVKTTMK